MIGDAVDTLITLAAYMALVMVIPALLLGHQGQHWPPGLWWRTVRAARARRGAQAPAGAPQGASRDSRDTGAPSKPAERRTAPRPSWAHEQPIEIEEAA